MIDCRSVAMAAQGSAASAPRRRGTVSMVKLAGTTPSSSSHVIGVATGAPGRARVEYGR